MVGLLDARQLLSPRCCGDLTEKFNIVPLTDVIPQVRMRGVQNPSAIGIVPDASTTYREYHGRNRSYTQKGNTNKWQLYRQVNGRGFLCHLFGMSNNLEIRITIDGANSITFYSQGTSYKHLLWGIWSQKYGDVDGFFMSTGYGILTPQYLFNFKHGCVEFKNQLKIEYKNRTTWASHTLAMDYLMESEVKEIEL